MDLLVPVYYLTRVRSRAIKNILESTGADPAQ
jgi:hypothetical protein